MSHTFLNHRQRPDLKPEVIRLYRDNWPKLGHSPVAKRWSAALFEDFAEYQCLLRDARETVAAAASTVPIAWDGTREHLPAGWDAALDQAFADHRHHRAATTLVALSVTVDAARQGRGVSAEMVRRIREMAAAHGFSDMIIPLRPSLKSRYPLTPMERYVRWQREDGLPFDPWLRVHKRAGGEFLGVVPASLVTLGTVEEWEEWTGLRFPESGTYVVPHALEPITIDCERDRGLYEETNVWVRHRVGGELSGHS